ncbi:MAG: hypothetical protein HY332_06405 [Chloroflexi bacterium]|nr:hypothetical protein [Chloroflexota bacterium]
MAQAGDEVAPTQSTRPTQRIGDLLVERGWQQGSVFRVPEGMEICFVSNELGQAEGGAAIQQKSRRVKARERLVVVTQTCDIKAGEQAEPTVEVLICTVEKSSFVQKVGPNSARWFVIDAQAGLVAQAKYRVQIAKQVLAQLEPELWPGTSERWEQFVRWLARRYGRPAVDDRIVEAFQRPVTALFDQLEAEQPELVAAFNQAVREVRITQPTTDEPPFKLVVVLLTRGGDLTEEEQRAIGEVAGALDSGVDPRIVQVEAVEVRSEDTYAVRDYFATVPLYLEYFTYRGDDVEGAEPFGTP